MNIAATMSTRQYHAAGRRRQQRLIRRTLTLTLLLVVLLASVLALRARADAPVTEPLAYVVQPGDTLWTIAERHTTEDRDPRELVNRVMRFNHLTTASLMPGQKLYLPAPLFAATTGMEVTARAGH